MGKFLPLGIPLECSRWQIVSAQQRKITGKPTSSGDGNDLTYVAMMLKGFLTSTNTTTNGECTMYLPDRIIALQQQ
ncbi:hypothetical protein [Dyadobacter sp. MSC1_007]|jgi:hypothetical protein|uniref:hypothetical protein n=1 Tax=Dyadobacter sp. MSC1_007 TaxID=2909264 RepID=UPI00202DE223|nr:hypothetical protein [Dyadobacter sp. MSC1_007]